MLFWEVVASSRPKIKVSTKQRRSVASQSKRLPFDKRCTAITKSGRRCRGRIYGDGMLCIFHDPAFAAKRRQRLVASAGRRRRRLTHIPDGYLRKLTNRRTVGQAMDRLYREVRLGIITPEMGRVLFNVLNRMLDSGLADDGNIPRHVHRTKAWRTRPKLIHLLTRVERVAWRKAMDNATTTRPQDPPGMAAAEQVQSTPQPQMDSPPPPLRLQPAS